ncbi:NMD3 [Acanthosepion pharaonis]|uniref:60S ribosomal export protein NMD3 n=1 Tax=Acanthosepion pharaonis TaxID=158019 RepID=A0A812DBF1_ACAPH|nr:NMD3 [Sepia pharaonis]
MHQNTVNIKPMHGGLDFYFAGKQGARKLVDFLLLVVPCRYQTAQELISMDIHSNIANYKTTFSVELVPICKDNVVCISKKLARSLGSISQLCVVFRVTRSVHLIDPLSLQEDLEEDDSYRQNVNIFKDSTKTPVDLDDIEDEHLPQISLQEMLDDMKLVDPTGGDGAEMIE